MKSLPSHTLFFSLLLSLAASVQAQQSTTLDAATLGRLQQQQTEQGRANPSRPAALDARTKQQLEYQANNPTNVQNASRTPLRDSDVAAARRNPLTASTNGEHPVAKELEHVTTIVFISESIPGPTLAPIIRAGINRSDIIYVLRGWNGDGKQLKPMIARMYNKAGFTYNKNDPDNSYPKIQLMVLPKAFRTYDIQRVPAYVIKSKKAGWRGIMGNISPQVASDEIEAGRWGQTIGTTWAVAEPDKAKEYEDKLRNMTPEMLAKQRESMMKDANTALTTGSPLPLAKVAAVKTFDPAVELDKDIIVDGKVRARKGQRVNALAIDPSGHRYFAAIDATDTWQLELAQKWATEHPNMLLFFTKRDARLNSFPLPAYPVAKAVVARIGITEVPSLVSQDGLLLRVQTFVK